MKEITGYRAGSIRVYWEHKCNTDVGDSVTSTLYINDVQVGSEFNNTGTVYEACSGDATIYPGDLIQIWAKRIGSAITFTIANQRIQYDDFGANDPPEA